MLYVQNYSFVMLCLKPLCLLRPEVVEFARLGVSSLFDLRDLDARGPVLTDRRLAGFLGDGVVDGV